MLGVVEDVEATDPLAVPGFVRGGDGKKVLHALGNTARLCEGVVLKVNVCGDDVRPQLIANKDELFHGVGGYGLVRQCCLDFHDSAVRPVPGDDQLVVNDEPESLLLRLVQQPVRHFRVWRQGGRGERFDADLGANGVEPGAKDLSPSGPVLLGVAEGNAVDVRQLAVAELKTGFLVLIGFVDLTSGTRGERDSRQVADFGHKVMVLDFLLNHVVLRVALARGKAEGGDVVDVFVATSSERLTKQNIEREVVPVAEDGDSQSDDIDTLDFGELASLDLVDAWIPCSMVSESGCDHCFSWEDACQNAPAAVLRLRRVCKLMRYPWNTQR